MCEPRIYFDLNRDCILDDDGKRGKQTLHLLHYTIRLQLDFD